MPPAPSPFTLAVTETLRRYAAAPPSQRNLEKTLRYLAKWRAELLANSVAEESGAVVLAGPFKGMAYVARASEGARVTRLIGSYEAALAPVIEEIIASAPELIVDIGCAEGYYAVGLARRLPGVRVLARDADARAQGFCRDMAEANGVAGQVEVGGLFTHADFAVCTGRRAVILCDIEGAEEALLDPEAAPALRGADILVECHEAEAPGLTDRLAARFAESHVVKRLGRRLDDSALPAWMDGLSDLDRLLALWEWRGGPTPWLWMRARGAA